MNHGPPGVREERLEQILDFFGVPWIAVEAQALDASAITAGQRPYAVFGSVEALAGGLTNPRSANVLRGATALYGFATDNRAGTLAAISSLCGGEWAWSATAAKPASVEITASCPEFTGPMSGIRTYIPQGPADTVLTPVGGDSWAGIVTTDDRPAFFRVQIGEVPLYICSSAEMPDIDEPVGRNYYDVKAHFLSAVPLVMFITSVFREVMWRARELGACLIIDDPLLKPRYGFCDFPWLRDRMRAQRFTTNIAFIPWNWRRTSRRASQFFLEESDLFSVSIHGCDHIAAEFGSPSADLLNRRARLAQTRMRQHQARTGIAHDPVMVFPQGVFSAECPAVLKHNDFIAAVNTEVSPVGDGRTATRVRDVWDVAILRYGSFPIYTRRYERHGLENFAFDLLLGKPCFIVAHHDEFRGGATPLLSLIDKLQALQCTLHWRSPGEVVRRAYRVRADGDLQARMYGTELRLTNAGERPSVYHVHKPETRPESIAHVTIDGHEVGWSVTGEDVTFPCVVPAHGEALVRVGYRAERAQSAPASVAYQVSVAARRVLSEFRDEYVRKLSPGPSLQAGHERL